MSPGEEIEARFRFDWAPSDIDRIRDISITFEALKFDMGVDYKKGIVRFRDLPVAKGEQSIAMKVNKTTASGKSAAQAFTIEKVVVAEKDNVPPFIEINFPEGIILSAGKQMDGRGVPVTHNVNNMTDGRTRAVPVTHNVNNMTDGRTRAVPVTHNVNNMEDGRQRAVPVTHNVNNMEDKKPRDLVNVLDEQITISGKVTDASSIYEIVVNGREAMILDDGSFKCKVMLKEGTNLITIRAMDIYQNVTEQSFKIFRAKSEKQPSASSDTEDIDLVIKPKTYVGKYYALIIAVNEYPDEQINNLNEPINDATKLAEVLVNDYSFDKENVFFLKNGTRGKVIDAFDFLNRKLRDNDNLVVFYAGHGHWDFDSKWDIGYHRMLQ